MIKAPCLKVGWLIKLGRTNVYSSDWSFSQSVFICGCISSAPSKTWTRKAAFWLLSLKTTEHHAFCSWRGEKLGLFHGRRLCGNVSA
jgi:hypothetical protein